MSQNRLKANYLPLNLALALEQELLDQEKEIALKTSMIQHDNQPRGRRILKRPINGYDAPNHKPNQGHEILAGSISQID